MTDIVIHAVQFDPFGKGAYILAGNDSAWIKTFDFTADNGGFEVTDGDLFPVHAGQGTYVAGTGWRTTYANVDGDRVRGLALHHTLASFTESSIITSVSLTYDLTNSGNWDGTPNVHGVKYTGINNLATTGYEGDSSGSDKVLSASGLAQVSLTVDKIYILLVSGRKWSGGDPGGQATAKLLTVSGTGVNPFGSGDSSAAYSVYYTPDVFEASPTWYLGEALFGQSQVMRLGSTQGVVYVFDSEGGAAHYSDDYGATWTALNLDSGSGGANGGGDVIPVGGVSLFAGNGTIEKATTFGGAYSAEANGALASGEGQMVKVPYYQFGSTTTKNTGTSPQYLLGGTELITGHSLWRVTTSGKTGITPETDVAISPNGAAMPTFDGRKIAVLMSPDGTLKRLWTSTNQGGSFTDRGYVSSDADYLTTRRGDRTGQQLFFADGTLGPAYSGDFGATIVHKSLPSEGTLTPLAKGIAPYG